MIVLRVPRYDAGDEQGAVTAAARYFLRTATRAGGWLPELVLRSLGLAPFTAEAECGERSQCSLPKRRTCSGVSPMSPFRGCSTPVTIRRVGYFDVGVGVLL